MVTDEQLMDRLRSSMHAATDDVFPPRGFMEGLPPASARRLRRPNFGGLIVAFATVSTVAVVVVAIVFLGRSGAPANRIVAPVSRPPAAADTLAALRSELGILRRPQTAADRLPGWEVTAEERPNCSNCLNVAKVIRRQTRLVATIRAAGGAAERIYLVLGTVPKAWGNGRISGWRQGNPTIEGLHLSLVGFTNERTPGAQELLNPIALAMPAGVLTPRDVLITGSRSVGVVPDGVTKVKWELDNPGQAKPVTVYPAVHGNVAAAPWTPAPRYTSLRNEQLIVGATWYGRDGSVIASFNDLAQVTRQYGHPASPRHGG